MNLQPSSSNVFTLFPRLPAELREKIWIQTIDWRSHILPRPPITELAVCHEAREALLKVYRPCFRPLSLYKKDDTSFAWGTRSGERWLEIQGMGNRSPRSPYANYETDVLYFQWAVINGFQQDDSIERFFFQEAIQKIKHVLVSPNAWKGRRHGGPMIRAGAQPTAPKLDWRMIVTKFGALKTISFADEPKARVSRAPLSEDQLHALEESRLRGQRPFDNVQEYEKSALRSSFAEGKILVPSHEPIRFVNPRFKLDHAKQWIERKAKEVPDWSLPKLQFATIIPDPEG